MSNGRSAADIAAKEQALRRRFYMRLSSSSNPFKDDSLISDRATCLEVFVPTFLFPHSPKGWYSMSTLAPSIRHAYLCMILLLEYIAEEIGDRVRERNGATLPDQVSLFRVVKHRDETRSRPAGYALRVMNQHPAPLPAHMQEDEQRERNEADDGDIEVEGQEEEGNNSDNDEVAATGSGNGNGKKKKKKQSQKQKKKPEVDKSNFGAILQDLIDENDRQAWAKRKKRTRSQMDPLGAGLAPQTDEARHFLHHLTIDQYTSLCSVYLGRELKVDDVKTKKLSDPENIAHPCKVFSLARSCELATRAVADERECSECELANPYRIDEQGHQAPMYAFPHPECVYRIPGVYMHPGTAMRVYWPTIQPPAAQNGSDANRSAFMQHMGTDAADAESSAFVYEQELCRNDFVEEEKDSFEAQRVRLAAKVEQVRRDTQLSAEEQQMEIERLKMEALSDFEMLFNVDGDAPDAIKAIARFMQDYLNEFQSFCLETPKVTSNLTRFGDEMIFTTMTLEQLGGVLNNHSEVVNLLVKQWYPYFNTDFNAHTLYHGPERSGKSFAMKMVMALLIEGTYLNTTYMSPKAMAIPGNKYQFMLRFMEDVDPTFLGITHTSKGKSTSDGTGKSLVKAWLTSSKMNAAVFDNEAGRSRMNAKTAEVQSLINTSLTAASNSSYSNVPSSMASRTDQQQWVTKDRLDGGGMMNRALQQPTAAQRGAREMFVWRTRRNQALAAYIELLIYVGILPQIEMGVATKIVVLTLQKAREKGLCNTDDPRRLDRIMMEIKVLVVWDAIINLWDSHDSPFRQAPHDPKHFLYVGRYLRATVEHTTMALGLLAHQYEDVIIYSIVNNLHETYYSIKAKARRKKERLALQRKQQVERIDDQYLLGGGNTSSSSSSSSSSSLSLSTAKTGHLQQAQIDVVAEEDANYFIAPFKQITREGVRSHHHADSNMDRVRWLATQQRKTMAEPPLMDDLIAGYVALLNKTFPDEEAADKIITALDFSDDGKILLSKRLWDNNKEHALKECLAEVLNHRAAKNAEYIYGVPINKSPHLLQTIKVDLPDSVAERNKVANILRVPNPKFFERKVTMITHRYIYAVAQAIEKKRQQRAAVPRNKLDRERCEERDENEAHRSAAAEFSLASAFAVRSHEVVDMDLNEYADLDFTVTEGFRKSLIDGLPDGHPLRRRDYLIQVAEEQGLELVSYPEGMPQHDMVGYVEQLNKQVELKPKDFAISALLRQKMIETNHYSLQDEQQQQQQESSSSSSSSSQPAETNSASEQLDLYNAPRTVVDGSDDDDQDSY